MINKRKFRRVSIVNACVVSPVVEPVFVEDNSSEE